MMSRASGKFIFIMIGEYTLSSRVEKKGKANNGITKLAVRKGNKNHCIFTSLMCH